jgi:hypothetical protein
MITNANAISVLSGTPEATRQFTNEAKQRLEAAQADYARWRELSDIRRDPDARIVRGVAMKVTKNGSLLGYNGIGEDNKRDAYIHLPKSGGHTYHVVLETDGKGSKTFLLKSEEAAKEAAEIFVATGRKPKATPTKGKNT